MTITPTSLRPSQAALHPAPQPDCDLFARMLLDAVRGATWAGWTTYPAPTSNPQTSSSALGVRLSGLALATETAADTQSSTAHPAQPDPVGDAYDPDCVDALLDKVEREAALAEVMGALLPPCPPAGPERPSTWHPKPVTLLAILKLARTFAHPEAMVAALGAQSALTLLGTGSTALDKMVRRVLEAIVVDDDIWPEAALDPVVMLADYAMNTGSIDRHQPLATLTDKTRDAVEQGTPLILITPVAGTAPKGLRDLRPQVIAMAPLDWSMLALLMDMAYPGQNAPAALTALPEEVVLSRLGPDALTLALRAPDPDTAIRAIMDALTPSGPDAGFGLAEFPLPDSLRAPVQQLIADLRDWQDGRLARPVGGWPSGVGQDGTGEGRGPRGRCGRGRRVIGGMVE